MLPPALSSERCTLGPGEEKLAVTVTMELAGEGALERYEIAESVILSDERMIYADVAKILEGEEERLELRYAHVLDNLLAMADCARVLRARRLELGSVDFDLPEAEIILNAAGRIEAILKAERTEAHQMIEEFMLLANRTVAGHLAEREGPMLYRVHEQPDPEKMSRFAELCLAFGHILPATVSIKPGTLQRLLETVKGRPEERLISTVMLRSMMQARYSEENVGHFGLAFDCYTHFTSPIRRYPDLVVHRLVKATLPNGRATRSGTLQRLLETVKGRPEERLISTVMLRSMMQARYSEENVGHFGLAFDCYTHFTSPIRRYPDLVVHRLVKATLPNGRASKRKADTWAQRLPEIAELSSERERVAEAAEREMVDLKKCHYMLGRIGERFDGYVSGVVPFGFFVELEELFVEGLVRLSDIPGDYFLFDEKTHTLIGDRSGKRFRLGDKVRVEVADVDITRRRIDFILPRPVRRR